jgi:NodT family efflux transporter outer membrane factor (OMF) lipoprotein
LAACTVGPDYRPPAPAALAVPDSYVGPGAAPAAAADLSRWWERFDDPLLTRLVDEASAGNLDIQVASARLVQAREALVQARANQLPSAGASASVGRDIGAGNDRTSFSLGGDASWQVDLFGGLRRGVEAAGADAQTAYFNREATRVAIAAEVASNYIDARLAQARLVIARDTLAIADDNLQIARWRVQAGLASSLDSEQARASRAQTAASIPNLETSYSSAAYRLAVLTGRAPGALLDTLAATQPIPRGPAQVAAGIPADTLRQRPDVRAAERGLASATARIGVAEAQLLPDLRLTGNIGTSAFSLGGLFDAITGGLLGSLGQTLFDGGALRSQVRSQRAAADAALATYRQSVLTALEDVENALAALDAARRREAEFTVALDAANNSAILARSQYRSGLIDFQSLNQTESQLLSARDGLANSQAAEASALVQLYQALGGGWTPIDSPPTNRNAEPETGSRS